MHLPACVFLVSFGIYRPLNFPLIFEVVEKRQKLVVLGPRFLGGRDIPDSDKDFQIALISEHVAGFG